MRILASNPDTIGDFVLRQPLYEALKSAGHELALLVREAVVPLAPQVAPGARVLPLALNPYSPEEQWPGSAAREALAAAEAFHPDLLLVAPFQWTAFEERLAERLPGVRRVGFAGRLYRGDIEVGLDAISAVAWDDTVDVPESLAEVRKNERLASAVLRRSLALPDPRLAATEGQTTAARELLSRSGLSTPYWVACVGDSPHTRVRNWPHELWGHVLARWAEMHGDRFLLVGVPAETAALDAIRAGMGAFSSHAVLAAGEELPLGTLVGCLASARGYVGRDTGPMHLAAALGKPVLSVFGGGTWPRFLPAVDPSCCLTVDVPCAGCDWACHLPESYCVKRVPVEAVLSAMEDLRAGRITRRTTRVLPRDEALTARLVQGSAASAREKARETGRVRHEFSREVSRLESEAQRAVQRFVEKSEEVRLLSVRVNETWEQLQVRQARLDDVSRDLDRSEALRRDLEVKLARAEADVTLLLTQVRDLGRDLRHARDQGAEASAELARKAAEAAATQAQLEQFRAESDQLRTQLLAEKERLSSDVILYHGRVQALLSSRWRKVGIRLGIAKRLPWETT